MIQSKIVVSTKGAIVPAVEPSPKQIYKLIHRYRRLCYRADAARGTVINLEWYHWAGLIQETLDELEALGVDTENDDRLRDPTFKEPAA